MHVGAIEYDLHLGQCHSLKEKRAVVKPIVEGLRRRLQVSAAEVGSNDRWQRARIGVSVVSASYGHACEVLDDCDRFVWSHPEVEVLAAERRWLDEEA